MSENVFKILSIDGGGIKGLYASTILERFEERFNCQISDYVDMICGTSTGGLIALGLSLKIPAKTISELYVKQGQKIFPKKLKCREVFNQVFNTKYKTEPLKQALEKTFKKKKIKDCNNLLCIPSYDITDGRNWVFKYDHGNLTRDNEALCVDVALATTAAPSFFPMMEILFYNRKQFIDGGIWANNPVLVGLIEAIKFFVGKDKQFDSIKILSISSLTRTGGKKVGIKRARGLIDWRNDLFETILSSQSNFTNYFMETFSNVGNIPIEYIRIPSESIASEQEDLVKLDNACADSISLIKGKGEDASNIWAKRQEILDFFSSKKNLSIK